MLAKGGIKMFIKYGSEEHLQTLMEQGEMFFNPCKYFRELEAEQLLKGIGDRNDGGIVTDDGKIVLQDRQGKFYFAEKQSVAFIVPRCLDTPTFCIKQAEKPSITLQERENLKVQFPNHTHALIIEDEHSLLQNIAESFDGKAFSHRIYYENKFTLDFLNFLWKGKSDICFDIPKSTPRYYAEMLMEPLDRSKQIIHFRVDDTNFYKTMFRKSVFFSNQSEYRIVLPYEQITSGKKFRIHPLAATLCKIDDLVK